jgi:hypothetical protein
MNNEQAGELDFPFNRWLRLPLGTVIGTHDAHGAGVRVPLSFSETLRMLESQFGAAGFVSSLVQDKGSTLATVWSSPTERVVVGVVRGDTSSSETAIMLWRIKSPNGSTEILGDSR